MQQVKRVQQQDGLYMAVRSPGCPFRFTTPATGRVPQPPLRPDACRQTSGPGLECFWLAVRDPGVSVRR
uniref:Uncharacterized protein n=1 Tax=Knipowitschia caucasica TaxID=637954 RepID=A0AAV2J698_KNICA